MNTFGRAISDFWKNQEAFDVLKRIAAFEGEKTYRPTVVVPIIDYVGRPLVVRHATTGNWGLVQGHIESFDADPVAACRRECFEEAFVTDEKIDRVYPFLWEQSVDVPIRNFQTGYSKGGYYVCVGIRMKAGSDVSIEPPRGQPPSLLARQWCSSLDQAIMILRDQPGVEGLAHAAKEKVERVLIPALESMYQPHVESLAEILNYNYV